MDRVTTSGFLTLGDRHGSMLIDRIRIDGISYTSADAGVKFEASWVAEGQIEVFNSPTIFDTEVEIVAGGHILMNTSFTSKSAMKWSANKDCNTSFVEGTFKLLVSIVSLRTFPKRRFCAYFFFLKLN